MAPCSVDETLNREVRVRSLSLRVGFRARDDHDVTGRAAVDGRSVSGGGGEEEGAGSGRNGSADGA